MGTNFLILQLGQCQAPVNCANYHFKALNFNILTKKTLFYFT